MSMELERKKMDTEDDEIKVKTVDIFRLHSMIAIKRLNKLTSKILDECWDNYGREKTKESE